MSTPATMGATTAKRTPTTPAVLRPHTLVITLRVTLTLTLTLTVHLHPNHYCSLNPNPNHVPPLISTTEWSPNSKKQLKAGIDECQGGQRNIDGGDYKETDEQSDEQTDEQTDEFGRSNQK